MNDRLLTEIAEQPAVAERVADTPLSAARTALSGRSFLYVAARGSSDNAAMFGKYLFESHTHIAVSLAAPSLFTRYKAWPTLRHAAVLAISQSGRAPDVTAVLRVARRIGAPTIAVTNAPSSALARAARHVVPLRAGPEHSVAATKTYTATCLVLARLAGAPVDDAANVLSAALRLRPDAERLARRIRGDTLAVIGRGFSYPSALEVALKVKELARVWATADSAADFEHGPIVLAGRGSTVLLVAARGPTLAGTLALVRRLRSRGTRVLALTDDVNMAENCDDAVLLDVRTSEHLAALALVVPGQYLARSLAIRRGLDPESPAGLMKVTRTR